MSFEPIEGVGVWTVVTDSSGQALDFGLVAVHMALLSTGKVLAFAHDEGNPSEIDRGKSILWNPVTNEIARPPLGRNLFCSGHCFLPDGRLFVAGGQSTAQSVLGVLGSWILGGWWMRGADHDIHTFSPVSEAWTRHQPDMPGARWYPTCTPLSEGGALIVSGYAAHAYLTMNEDFEVFEPGSNSLSQPAPFMRGIGLYPFVHLLPGNYLFVHSRDTTRLFDLNSGAWLSTEFRMTGVGTRTYPGQGACVVLPMRWDGFDVSSGSLVRVLIVGGSTSLTPDETTPATRSVEIFEFDRQHPELSHWRATTPTTYARFMSDAILLPDGTVFVCNGASRGKADSCSGPVTAAEVFDPETETWHVMPEATIERLYHSTGILLPDGRVLTAGSTGDEWRIDGSGGNHNERRMETFAPPYLRPTVLPCEQVRVAIDKSEARLDALQQLLAGGSSNMGALGGEPLPCRRILEDVQGLEGEIEILQAMLIGASPEEKEGIVALIRRLRVELGRQRNNLAACRRPFITSAIDAETARLERLRVDLVSCVRQYESPPRARSAPTIQSAPPEIEYGQSFDIQAAAVDTVEAVVLLRPTSTTHTNNMDQRYVRLPITDRRADGIVVTSPLNANVAPQGRYMLFLVKGDRFPSNARMIDLRFTIERPIPVACRPIEVEIETLNREIAFTQSLLTGASTGEKAALVAIIRRLRGDLEDRQRALSACIRLHT